MSRAGEKYLMQYEEGWHSTGEKYVCEHCFTDDSIKEFIHENSIEYKCDYCNLTNNKPIAAHMDIVLELVARSLLSEWTDPAEELPYESKEGGYQGNTYDTYEVLWEIEFPTENELLLDDIVRGLTQEIWCRKSPFQLSEDQMLFYTWEDFCYAVKHQTRYLFFTQDEDEYSPYTPSQILDEIGTILFGLGLVKPIKVGTPIIRARGNYKWVKLNSAKELGTPPVTAAFYSNRMSPAGIPMFYGAFEEYTAIAEVVSINISPCKVITLATFYPTRDLHVLDLTNLPEVPSLFSDEKRHLRDPISFLHKFAEDISKPVAKDGYEHINYVPTQVVTDYIRKRFFEEYGNKPDGIIYKSSLVEDGSSIVLFVSNDQCVDRSNNIATDSEKILELRDVRVSQINPKISLRSLIDCVKARWGHLRNVD
jgi:hypothetical protein